MALFRRSEMYLLLLVFACLLMKGVAGVHPCPGGKQFPGWSEFSECSVTCGVGIRTRMCLCPPAVPEASGDGCIIEDDIGSQEEMACNLDECPLDKKTKYFIGIAIVQFILMSKFLGVY